MTAVQPIQVPITVGPVAVDLPPKTPKWIIHTVATAVALVPILLALWQPRGAFTTPAAQAAIVLAGLVGAVVIFAVTLVAENVAHYGLTKAAVAATVSTSEAELRQLLPEARQLFDTAKPLVDQLGGANDLIAGLQGAVADVQTKLDQIPAGQRQAAIDALTGLLATSKVNVGAAPPPPPSPPTVANVGGDPNTGTGAVAQVTGTPPADPHVAP